MQWARLTKELLDAEGRWISPAVHLEYLRGVADWICYVSRVDPVRGRVGSHFPGRGDMTPLSWPNVLMKEGVRGETVTWEPEKGDLTWTL